MPAPAPVAAASAAASRASAEPRAAAVAGESVPAAGATRTRTRTGEPVAGLSTCAWNPSARAAGEAAVATDPGAGPGHTGCTRTRTGEPVAGAAATRRAGVAHGDAGVGGAAWMGRGPSPPMAAARRRVAANTSGAGP